jgi:hypothetical protein
MVCGWCSLPSLYFLDYASATQRVAGMSRLVLHSLIHFLRPEDLFAIGDGYANALPNRVLIFALKRQNVGEKGFDALVHRLAPRHSSVIFPKSGKIGLWRGAALA